MDLEDEPRELDLQRSKPHDFVDWDDFEFISANSGKHVHLRLIDTPGLDDSNNATMGDDIGQSTNEPKIKQVDAKHKLSILKAMHEAKALHGVCIVINSKENLKGSTIESLREFIQMFESANLGRSYHFLHTHVDSGDLFGDSIRKRPQELEREIGVGGGRASHHLVNSLLDRFSLLNRYLTNLFISNFLGKISSAPSESVRSLVFSKQDGRKRMDKKLILLIEAEQDELREAIKKRKNKIATLNKKDKMYAEREVEFAMGEYHVKKAETEEWDTKELVVVQSRRLEESVIFHGSISFQVRSPCRIRKVEWDQCADAIWVEKDEIYLPWTRLIEGTLENRKTFTTIWGEITIKGYKRDYNVEKVELKKKAENQALMVVKQKRALLEKVDLDIKLEEAAIAKVEGRLEEWERKKKVLGLHSVELFNPNQASTGLEDYFASSEILGYTLGYGALLSSPIPMKNRSGAIDSGF